MLGKALKLGSSSRYYIFNVPRRDVLTLSFIKITNKFRESHCKSSVSPERIALIDMSFVAIIKEELSQRLCVGKAL